MNTAIYRLTIRTRYSICHDMRTQVDTISVEILFGYDDTKFYKVTIKGYEMKLTRIEFMNLFLAIDSITTMEFDSLEFNTDKQNRKNYDN